MHNLVNLGAVVLVVLGSLALLAQAEPDAAVPAMPDAAVVDAGLPDAACYVSGGRPDDPDAEAMRWWLRSGAHELERLREQVNEREAFFIVHLPSGITAFPGPEILPQGATVHVIVIRDAARPGVVSLGKVEGCTQSTSPARIRKAVAWDKKPPRSQRFSLFPLATLTNCKAGFWWSQDDSYALTVEKVKRTTVVTVRPRRHALAMMAYGWDTGDTTVDGEESRDELYAGLMFPLLGLDGGRRRASDYLLNAVLATDVRHPRDAYLIGAALRWPRGLSLVLGVSLRHDGRDAGFFVGMGIDDQIFTSFW
jgi:hypothetical protein